VSDFGGLTAEVAAAFDLGAPLAPMVEAAGGEQARIWRLDTSAGSFAVKQPRRSIEPRADGVDVAFQEAVGAQTDVPMPMPVRRPGGAFVIPVGDWLVRVSTWVDLLPPDPRLDPVELGRLLAGLHQVDFALSEEARVDPWYCAPVGQEAWDDLAARLERGGAPFAATLQTEMSHLVELENLLEAPRDLRMCHRDLWADNVLRTTSGQICVIDWDNCGAADPSHELAVVVFEFGQGERARMRALYDAYRNAGGPGRLERPGQLTMVIAQFGHFWEMAAGSWLHSETSRAERGRAEDRVSELMTRPLRSQLIGDMIAALA